MAGDMDVLTSGRPIHVPAEVISELMGAHRLNLRDSGEPGVELGGFEPPTFRLPAGRSFQLSYSPERLRSPVYIGELELARPQDRPALGVTGGCHAELDPKLTINPRDRKEITLVELGAVGGVGVDLLRGVSSRP